MTEVRVDGTWFCDNDVTVLRLLDRPGVADEIVERAVRAGVSRALARGILERLWIVGAVEKDRVRIHRSSFGDEVVERVRDARRGPPGQPR